jgi:hypothetical protein
MLIFSHWAFIPSSLCCEPPQLLAFSFDADPAFYFDAYPDPDRNFHFDAYPDPDPTFTWIRIRLPMLFRILSSTRYTKYPYFCVFVKLEFTGFF